MDFIKNPRGLRNNNPGNIRHGNDWKGEKVGDDKAFETFTSVEYGIRAIYKLLQTYSDKYNAKSIHDAITRFAPASENNTNGYINHVYDYMLAAAKESDKTILLRDKHNTNVHQGNLIHLFVAGIILHENGFQPFNLEFIKECQKL